MPTQDKQYLFAILKLPEAATIDRTDVVLRRMGQIALDNRASPTSCSSRASMPCTSSRRRTPA